MKLALVLLLPLAGFCAQTSAQTSAQTADEIVAKHIKARGGAAKFAAIHAVRVKGRLKSGDGPYRPVEVLATASGKFRMELTAGGQAILQRYDGKTAYQGNEPATGEDATQILDQATGALAGQLWDYKKNRIKIETGGRGKWHDHDVLLLRLKLPTGTPMTIYLDPKTFLEIAEDITVKVNGKETVIEETVTDHHRFGGVLFPSAFQSGIKGQPAGEHLEMQEIEINPAIDDAVFRPK
jgi:outer membrane lipoprotein-sorting protein